MMRKKNFVQVLCVEGATKGTNSVKVNPTEVTIRVPTTTRCILNHRTMCEGWKSCFGKERNQPLHTKLMPHTTTVMQGTRNSRGATERS